MTNTGKPARAKPDKAVFVKLTQAILTLAGKYGRDKAEAILKKHGVSYAKQLRPEKWQAVLDEAEEEIAKARTALVTAPASPVSTPTQPAPPTTPIS